MILLRIRQRGAGAKDPFAARVLFFNGLLVLVARLVSVLSSLVVPLVAGAEGGPFEVLSIPVSGRTVAAELADFDGDGRADLMQIAVEGRPPAERRSIRVHLQKEEGGIPASPDFEVPLPAGAAAYDLADLRETAGTELVVLRHDGLVVLSLASPDAPRWELPVPGGGTVGAAMDERGLDRLRLAWREFGPQPWLLVPGLGEAVALSPVGDVVAVMNVGGRANYFVPPPSGLYFGESDIQLFFDAPRMAAGDIDGDGRVDVVASNRHALRVFLRRADGSFPGEADRVIPLGLVSERDHIRGSGGVTATARDIDGDGKLDLLVSYLSGGFTSARTETRVYLNRDGGWEMAEPDSFFHSKSSIGSDTLIDLDGDGKPELVRVAVPFSVLELIEALITSSVDANVEIYRFDGARFGEKPWAKLKLDVPLSFETFRPEGFLPALRADLNADGHRDLLLSGSGDQVEIFLGGPEDRYQRRAARQKFDTRGQLRFGDVDGDGLQDLLLFDPNYAGAALRIARNRGILPGTPPQLRRVAPRRP